MFQWTRWELFAVRYRSICSALERNLLEPRTIHNCMIQMLSEYYTTKPRARDVIG